MSQGLRLLVVDDDEVTRKLLKEVFEADGFDVQVAKSAEHALVVFQKEPSALVLSDIRMLEMPGSELLTRIKALQPDTVVVLMTGFGSMEGAVSAIRDGAFDYVSKPFKISELRALMGRAARHWESSRKPSVATGGSALLAQPKSLIGKSPQIVEVYKSIARAALSASNVLLVGESGTGKELVARAIHENSARRAKAMVAVNCGALAENLLESELFGHVKGAFTGAISDKKGLFEEANQSTLFLDEVGDISPALQVKLLRVLQEGEFKAVGSTDIRKTDARVVAATHRDLESMVKSGQFREDLYYRLKVISISIPALRDRREDIPDLVGYFVAKYSEKNKKAVSHVSDEAMALLQAYSWPGNVRELEHAIERAVAMTSTHVLFVEDFPAELQRLSSTAIEDESDRKSLEDVEREHIMRVLRETGFNKSKAAEILKIDRVTLYRKAQRLGISLGEK